ncbi:MAG: hypothetical protein JRH20_08230 [Deltaproteobacteria bacterium]|nr:hypothetical protein [Deltaproteobacteria bacterium]
MLLPRATFNESPVDAVAVEEATEEATEHLTAEPPSLTDPTVVSKILDHLAATSASARAPPSVRWLCQPS